jgi:uncharacterized protein YegP (UPF0339 family)
MEGMMVMSGYFELIDASGGGYRLRLLEKSGKQILMSVRYPTKNAAAAGVGLTREIAGTGLVRDVRRGHGPDASKTGPDRGGRSAP